MPIPPLNADGLLPPGVHAATPDEIRQHGNMNKEAERLAQTIEMLELMNDALRHLRTEVLPRNPRMFVLMAEGPLEEMRRLQEQIEQLTGELAASATA